jgi:ketosteroid isomerase-like protein
VQEWTATATHARPARYKDADLEPSGRTIRWEGMDIIPIRDGKVARKDVYANSLGYLRELGAPV